MKILTWILLLSVTVWAESVTVDLSSVRVTVKGVEQSYKESDTFDLAYEEELCLVGGEGMLTVSKKSGDTETLTLLGEKQVCLTLHKEKKVLKEDKSLFQKGKEFLCKESTDSNVNGLSRKDYEEEGFTDKVKAWVCE